MSEATDAVVKDYMRRLEKELKPLPKAQREEILTDIKGHVDESLGTNGPTSEADARAILGQLGDPAEIARDARERFGVAGHEFGTREIFTVILLPVGAFFFLIGWLVGVALLWSSNAWTKKEKLLGTFVLPGGMVFPLYLIAGLSLQAAKSCVTSSNQQGVTHTSCTGGTSELASVLISVGLGLLILVAIAIPIWLAVRARRRAGAVS